MKKYIIIMVLLLSSFFLAGCDQEPQGSTDQLSDDIIDQIEDAFPSVTIVGDSLITIEQYTTFVDPGALVTGDFDLDINIDSNVDTSVLGDYTITYSVIYEGVNYSDTRTVRVIEPIITQLPNITVIGNALMTVEIYSTFIDPGATVSDGFDLDIVTDSNVDTSLLGEYTVTYSVVYEGVTYSATRTVRVVEPPTPLDLEWILETTSLSYDTISIRVSYTDIDGVLTNGKGSLYQGDTLILSIDLNSGENLLSYSDLDPNTNYKFVIEGSYIDRDATVTIAGYELHIKTLELTNVTFDLSNELITHNAYSGDIEIISESSNIISKNAYLYLGENLVKTVALTTANTTFIAEGLLSDTEYILKVIYTASSIDGGANEEITEVLHTFSTPTQPVPTLALFLCEVDYTSAECGVGLDADGFTIESLRIEVWKDGSYHSLFQVTDAYTYVNITDLDPSSEYLLKLYADYKVVGSDELIAYTLLHEEAITTLVMEVFTPPTIENMVITTDTGSTNSITFDFDLLDPDGTIEGTPYFSMQIVDSSSRDGEIPIVGHNTITFTGYPVYANTLYSINLKTDYKVSEQLIEYGAKIYETTYLTPPNIEALSFSSNQSIYFHGDRFIMILELDNQDDLNVEYVTVNGDRIYKDDFLFPSTNEHIYLNMGVETDYTIHNYHVTDFAVTQVDDSSYVVEYDQLLTYRLQVPGSIDPEEAVVDILEITTDDYTVHLQDAIDDKTNVMIRLDNEYNLDIYSITVNGDVFLASQFEEGSTLKEIVINVDLNETFSSNRVSVRDLVFIRNGNNVDSLNDSVPSIEIYGYETEDVVNIGSAEELNSIDTSLNNKIYMLSANIDMQTITNFSAIGTMTSPLSGVFDGNGYTISNLNISSYSPDQSSSNYIGLFGVSYAFIYNVTLLNTDIYVLTNNTHELYIGTLAGKSLGTIIDSQSIGTNVIDIEGITQGYVGGLVGFSEDYVRDSSANTTITIDGLNNQENYPQGLNVGGLFGMHAGAALDTSSSSGSITIDNTNNVTYQVGGLVGTFSGKSSSYITYIKNSYSSVDVSTSNMGDGFTGGLVGKAYYYVGITNCYASGDVYGQRGSIGGIVGGEYVYVRNCFYTGNLSFYSGYFDLLTQPRNPVYLENNFVYDSQTLTSEGQAVTPVDDVFNVVITASMDEYNNAYDFYTRILKWSTYFFDISDLDIENDILPTHK